MSVGAVLLGHRHQRVSEGLRDWLQASFARVYIVGDPCSLVDGAQRLQPALVLFDTALAPSEVGPLVVQLHDAAPAARIVLLSGDHVTPTDLASLIPGRDGVVNIDALVRELSGAVDAVLAGRDLPAPMSALQRSA